MCVYIYIAWLTSYKISEHVQAKSRGSLSGVNRAAVRTLSLQQAEVLAGRAKVKDCHNVSHNGIRRIHRHTLNKIPFKCSTVEQLLSIFSIKIGMVNPIARAPHPEVQTGTG